MGKQENNFKTIDYLFRAKREASQYISAALIKEMREEWGPNWLDILNKRGREITTDLRKNDRSFPQFKPFDSNGKHLICEFNDLMRAIEHGIIILPSFKAIHDDASKHAHLARTIRNWLSHPPADLNPEDAEREHKNIDALVRLVDIVAGRHAGDEVYKTLLELHSRTVFTDAAEFGNVISDKTIAFEESPHQNISDRALSAPAGWNLRYLKAGLIALLIFGPIAFSLLLAWRDTEHNPPPNSSHEQQVGQSAGRADLDGPVPPAEAVPLALEAATSVSSEDPLEHLRESDIALAEARRSGQGIAAAVDDLIAAADALHVDDIASAGPADRIALANAARARTDRQAGVQRVTTVLRLSEEALIQGEPVDVSLARALGESYRALSPQDRERLRTDEVELIVRACRLKTTTDPSVLPPQNRCIPGGR